MKVRGTYGQLRKAAQFVPDAGGVLVREAIHAAYVLRTRPLDTSYSFHTIGDTPLEVDINDDEAFRAMVTALVALKMER